MNSQHKIDKAVAFKLRGKIQKASGLNQRDFQRVFGRDAEQKIIKICQKIDRLAVEETNNDKKYVMPPDLNPEQHIFNLAFNVPEKPLKVIGHAFREYNSEYGYWQPILEESLAKRVLEIANKARLPDTKKGRGKSLGTIANVRKTLDHAGIALFSNSQTTTNTHLIAFKNGTVCTKTGDISGHHPDHFITSGLPYVYIKGAECPAPMLRYIESSFGAENIEYARAGLGLMLDLTAKDKFIHAIGPSGSGKGVLTRLIMKFFGSESVGSPNNFKLFANPDQVHQYLSGKRLIAIDDIVGYVGEEIGRFYTAVERTAMNARCLFKPKGYTQQFDIRYIVCSTGQLPTKYSNNKGWERRVFPMPTVGRQEPDNNLEQALEGCIADIISWALAQDKNVRNAILEHPERYNHLADEYFIEAAHSSSSAWGFIEECLEPVVPHPSDTSETQKVKLADLYENYKAYCITTGRNAISLDNLKHELKQAIPANFISRKRDRVSTGKRIPAHFVYIKMVPFLFSKNEYGTVTCDLSKLSYGGVSDFKKWGKQYGSLYPYTEIPTPTVTPTLFPHENNTGTTNNINVTSECDKIVTQNVSDATKQGAVQAVQGVQAPNLDVKVCVRVSSEEERHTHTHFQSKGIGLSGLDSLDKIVSRLKWKNPEGLTVTMGLDTDKKKFERGLMASETIKELQLVKNCFSEELREEVMSLWQKDGRYQLLINKVNRLKKEADVNALE